MIKIIKYIILGIIQGFTEPLPISSSGHIYLLKYLFNTDVLSDLNFEIIVNTGSLIAILIIYFNDLKNLILNTIKYIKTKNEVYKIDFKYSFLIIIGTLPALTIGFLFKDLIENILSESIFIISISFIITSIFLYLIRNINGNKNDYDITWKDALFIGIIQVLALIPGISRSGSTLIAGIKRNIKRENAFKYSFMLYIPISIGTTILGISDIIKTNNSELIIPYFLGFIFSFIVSFFTLKWFRKFVQKGNLTYFAIYCLIIGILSLLFLL